jgi:hypothetical protein
MKRGQNRDFLPGTVSQIVNFDTSPFCEGAQCLRDRGLSRAYPGVAATSTNVGTVSSCWQPSEAMPIPFPTY